VTPVEPFVSRSAIVKATFLVIAITVFGAVLRLYGLADESLRLDEGYLYARITSSYWGTLTHWDTQWQGMLFAVVEKMWCDIFGHSEVSLRLLPALFGILTVPALYLLGRTLFSSGAGHIAALLVAVNPCAIYFSQDARPYSLFLLLSVVSAYFAIRSLRSESGRPRVLFALSALAGLYVHPYGVFLLPFYASLPFLPSDTPGPPFARRRYFQALAMVFAGYVPMLTVFARTFIGKMSGRLHDADFIPQATLSSLTDTCSKYFMSDAGAILVGLIAVPVLILRFRRRELSAALLIPFSLAACFVLIPWLASQVFTPIYFFRYTIPALAALLLILAWVLSTLRVSLRVFLILTLLAVSADSLADYYTKVDKDPWRQTVELLRPRLQRGDLVIVNPPWAVRSLRYYLAEGDSIEIRAPWRVDDIRARLETASRFWLITAYKGSSDLRTAVRQAADSCGIRVLSLSARDSVVVNPRAYLVGDIRADLYERKPRTER
jgi:4-amino-4-deoxy-L-arabinose transferase-like glycosyltransferase